MTQWRERFLAAILRFAFLFGVAAAVPSIIAAMHDGLPAIVVMDVLAVAAVFALWRGSGWPYRLRASGLLSVIYLMGAALLLAVGIASGSWSKSWTLSI